MAPLTLAQQQTLKTFILNDATLSTKASGEGTDLGFIANALNAAASPDFWSWKSLLSKIDAVSATSPDATTFSWTAYIARSQAERDAWAQIWNSTLSVNPSLDSVRSAFADIFSGANGAATRTHLLAMARRLSTLAEKLLATGTGSTGSPAKFGWEGAITITGPNGVQAILAS